MKVDEKTGKFESLLKNKLLGNTINHTPVNEGVRGTWMRLGHGKLELVLLGLRHAL